MSDSQLASTLRVICAIMLQYKLKCVTFLFFLSVATHRYAITWQENKKIELVLDEIEGVERYQEYEDQFIYFDVEEARIWCNLIFIPDDEFVKYTYGNNPVYYDKYVKYDTEKGKYVEKEFFDGKENLTLRYYREQVIPTENGEYNTKLSEEKEIILSHSIENLPDYLFDSQESGYGNVIILVPESRMEVSFVLSSSRPVLSIKRNSFPTMTRARPSWNSKAS